MRYFSRRHCWSPFFCTVGGGAIRVQRECKPTQCWRSADDSPFFVASTPSCSTPRAMPTRPPSGPSSPAERVFGSAGCRETRGILITEEHTFRLGLAAVIASPSVVKRDGGVHVLAKEPARVRALESGFDLFGARMQLFLRGLKVEVVNSGTAANRVEKNARRSAAKSSTAQRRQADSESLARSSRGGGHPRACAVRLSKDESVGEDCRGSRDDVAYQEFQVGLP